MLTIHLLPVLLWILDHIVHKETKADRAYFCQSRISDPRGFKDHRQPQMSRKTQLRSNCRVIYCVGSKTISELFSLKHGHLFYAHISNLNYPQVWKKSSTPSGFRSLCFINLFDKSNLNKKVAISNEDIFPQKLDQVPETSFQVKCRNLSPTGARLPRERAIDRR